MVKLGTVDRPEGCKVLQVRDTRRSVLTRFKLAASATPNSNVYLALKVASPTVASPAPHILLFHSLGWQRTRREISWLPPRDTGRCRSIFDCAAIGTRLHKFHAYLPDLYAATVDALLFSIPAATLVVK